MPLYEYQCEQCGKFEVIRKFSDAPLEACPTCGRPIQKLLSSPAIQFKGTGWYVTDYAKKSGGDSGKSEGSKAEGKTGSKTEGSKTEGSKDAGGKSDSPSAPAPTSAPASSTGSGSGSGSGKTGTDS
jgi:putative FmdB family regulatory protein